MAPTAVDVSSPSAAQETVIVNPEPSPYSLLVNSSYVSVDKEKTAEEILCFILAKKKASKRIPRRSLNLAASELRVPLSVVKKVWNQHQRITVKNNVSSIMVEDIHSKMSQREI